MFLISPTELAIDLGSSNTRIFQKGKGIVLNEPTIAAIRGSEFISAGSRAAAMIGRTPSPMQALHPIKKGAVADMSSAQLMLSHFIKQALGKTTRLFRPVKLSVCIPPSASELEKNAHAEVARIAGGTEITLLDSSVAAAYGMNLDASAPHGRLIADMGSGSSVASIVSLNGVVAHRSAPGGDIMDTAIADMVRERYSVIIGDRSAEYLKQAAGSLKRRNKGLCISVRGRSIKDGLPTRIDVDSTDITDAILPAAERIISAICRVYEEAPPELASDISGDGVYITGGLSMLHGISDLITEATGLRVHVSEKPFTSVAEGMLLCTSPVKSSQITA